MALVTVPSEPPDGVFVRAAAAGWHCVLGPKECAECCFAVTEPRWGPTIAAVHNPRANPIAAATHRNRFVVGCTTCRAATVQRHPFAEFRVETLACMQLGYIWRHIRGDKHINACRSLGGVFVDKLPLPGDRTKPSHAPPLAVFLWSLRCTFSAAAFLDYGKFIECSELSLKQRHSTTLATGTWSHSSMAKKAMRDLKTTRMPASQHPIADILVSWHPDR